MSTGVLVIGYGNALRTDDGLGWHVAERLTQDPRFEGVAVLQRHQLAPELSLDVSEAALVVLIDASGRLAPGQLAVSCVERATVSDSTWSHHLEPSVLVALAHELYGRAAEVFVVSCGVESLEAGDQLSPVVEAALVAVVEAVFGIVAGLAVS